MIVVPRGRRRREGPATASSSPSDGIGYDVLVAAVHAREAPAGRPARAPVHADGRARRRDDALRLRRHGRARAVRPPGHRDGVGPKVALAFLSVLTPDCAPSSRHERRRRRAHARPRRGEEGGAARHARPEGQARRRGGRDRGRAARRRARGPARARPLAGRRRARRMAALEPNGDRPVEDLLREALQHVGRWIGARRRDRRPRIVDRRRCRRTSASSTPPSARAARGVRRAGPDQGAARPADRRGPRAAARPIDHLLFSGPPGLGKTTLAGIVANEIGVGFRPTSGPALERAGRPRRDPDEPRGGRRPVRRRDPPDAARRSRRCCIRRSRTSSSTS